VTRWTVPAEVEGLLTPEAMERAELELEGTIELLEETPAPATVVCPTPNVCELLGSCRGKCSRLEEEVGEGDGAACTENTGTATADNAGGAVAHPFIIPVPGPLLLEHGQLELDGARLGDQAQRVFGAMSDGMWHTLAELSQRTGDPEASISARLRDFRRDGRWHDHVRSSSRRCSDGARGTWPTLAR
jgi:hypothetical protein